MNILHDMNNARLTGRLKRLCAVAIGLVFLVAGIFKLFDPVGAGLVMEEYFRFFHIPFLIPVAKVVATVMALLESLVGAALISGIWRRTVAFFTTVLVGFFTVLTLILAIANPEMDCGCFGEVIHLSHLQTFIKNIVLLALALFAFYPYHDMGANKTRKDISFAVVAVSLVAFMVFYQVNIPSVDYTAFAPGSELFAAGCTEGEGEEYSSSFIYEKNGQQGVFSLDKLPDSTWTFVRTETVHINRLDASNDTPALPFADSAGVSQDEKAAYGNVLVVSVYDPAKMKGETWSNVADALEGAAEAGFVPLLLINSTKDAIDGLETIIPEARGKIASCTYYADRKVLLALNRSNGGASWFSDGQLIRKFSHSDLPDTEYLLSRTGSDPTEEMLRYSTKGRLHFEGFILYASAILLLL